MRTTSAKPGIIHAHVPKGRILPGSSLDRHARTIISTMALAVTLMACNHVDAGEVWQEQEIIYDGTKRTSNFAVGDGRNNGEENVYICGYDDSIVARPGFIYEFRYNQLSGNWEETNVVPDNWWHQYQGIAVGDPWPEADRVYAVDGSGYIWEHWYDTIWHGNRLYDGFGLTIRLPDGFASSIPAAEKVIVIANIDYGEHIIARCLDGNLYNIWWGLTPWLVTAWNVEPIPVNDGAPATWTHLICGNADLDIPGDEIYAFGNPGGNDGCYQIYYSGGWKKRRITSWQGRGIAVGAQDDWNSTPVRPAEVYILDNEGKVYEFAMLSGVPWPLDTFESGSSNALGLATGITEREDGNISAALFVGGSEARCFYGVDGVWHSQAVTPQGGHLQFDWHEDSERLIGLLADYSVRDYKIAHTPEIAVVSPNGGEAWRQGTTQEIKWVSSWNPSGSVKIELYKGGSWNRTIRSSTPDDGSFDWPVAWTETVDSDYTVRVSLTSDSSVYDESDGTFSITAAPSIELTVPNGGEEWQQGERYEISWTYSGSTDSHVEIELYKGGSLNSIITTSTDNDGSYTFAVPYTLVPDSDYVVWIASTSDSSVRDVSDSYFSIVSPQPPPKISVTPASRDFGSVLVGSWADDYFMVLNEGGGTLTGNASVSSPFSVISGGSYSLTAGQTQRVDVQFRPTSAGAFSGVVTFTGGGEATKPVTGTGLLPTYTITASAGPNGLIVPAGDIVRSAGDDQQFAAYPDVDYSVDQWYLDGNPVQVGGTTYTSHDIQSDHTIYVTFKKTAETDPPYPNEIESITPASPTQIDIVSKPANDISPPVWYKIDGQSWDGSSWVDSGGGVSDYEYSTTRPNPWSDSGLIPNGLYRYRQNVKDSVDPSNESSWSDWQEKYTLANIPAAPITSSLASTMLDLYVDPNGNPPNTEYAIQCTSTSPHDLSWSHKWVDDSGYPADVEVWQTAPAGIGQTAEASAPSLIQDSSGRYWIAFSHCSDVYITNSLDGTTWGSPINVTNVGNTSSPSLIQDSAGVYRLAFGAGSAEPYRIYVMSSFDGLNWSSPVEVVAGSTSFEPCLIQNSNGTHWLAFNTYSGIYITRSDDFVNWGLPTTAVSGFVAGSSLIQDSGGKYWMAYYYHGGDWETYIVGSLDGMSWDSPVEIVSGQEDGYYGARNPELIQDSGGTYWMTYGTVDQWGERDVALISSSDAGNWSAPTTVAGGSSDDGYHSSIIQDESGTYWVVFPSDRSGDRDLWIAGSEVFDEPRLHPRPLWQPGGTRIVRGLMPNTTYSFRVKARNGDGVETSMGPPGIATTGSPKTVYVDNDAPEGGTGADWSSPYRYLQDALAVAAAGDEVRVAGGIYWPDQGGEVMPGDRTATFELTAGVVVKGGYAGLGAADPDARDPGSFVTILSGDLNEDDGPDFAHNTENSYHVVTASWTDDRAILSGFTIMSGNADGDAPHNMGGGIYNYAGNAKVKDCVLRANSTGRPDEIDGYGGGMYTEEGNLHLEDCVFAENSARGEGGFGGGMYNLRSEPELNGCVFNYNSAGQYGGGMCNNDSDPNLEDCTFIKNSAVYSGGGMGNYGGKPRVVRCTFVENSTQEDGGGMHNTDSDPMVLRCRFTKNQAGYGGALSTSSFSGGGTLANCLFSDNSADIGGGAIALGSPTLSNCTFVGNSADGAGGGMWNSSATITSCTFWGNSDAGGTDESAQIHAGAPEINYSCIQGWTGTLGGTGNHGSDPLFADTEGRLSVGSPCADAGDPDHVAQPDELDLDGNPRVVRGRIDMGAYEFQGQGSSDHWKLDDSLPDFSGDGKSDLLWRQESSGYHTSTIMNSLAPAGYGWLGGNLDWQIVGTPDFDGDGKSDLLWRQESTGYQTATIMNGPTMGSSGWLGGNLDWRIVATPDFNGDGKSDLLWRQVSTGYQFGTIMDGLTMGSTGWLGGDVDWKVVATPDFNGDGKSDLLWRQVSTGYHTATLMDGLTMDCSGWLGGSLDWQIVAAPDLNGDDKSDLLWEQLSTGYQTASIVDGLTIVNSGWLGGSLDWSIESTPDLNGDGKADLLWLQLSTGYQTATLMHGLTAVDSDWIGGNCDWQVIAIGDFNGDAKSDLLWQQQSTGYHTASLMNGLTKITDGWIGGDWDWEVQPVP